MLPTMFTTLIKKNIHSFFYTFPTSVSTTATTRSDSGGDHCRLQLEHHHRHHHHHHPLSPSGLGLIIGAAADSDHRPPNVVESTTLKPPSPPASLSTGKKIGFADEVGVEIDGLMCCTESLGFESSDERRVEDHRSMEEIHREIKEANRWDEDRIRRERRSGNCILQRARSYPPPLTSLNRNGEPSYFLRPVRKDGRLELTEVRIHRPEILHASRHDGRLTLHLIPDHSILYEDEDEDYEEEEELDEEEETAAQEEKEVEQEEQEEARQELEAEEVTVEGEEEEGEIGNEKDEEEEGGEEERVGGEWRLRRCHEMVNHHHHHHQFHGSHHHHLRMCV